MINVFIVDDEDAILSGIRSAILNLPGNKYQICGEASDGETAWPMILESKPDVVLADVRMPFMNGLELAKIVKKTLSSVKFIIISGHDEFEYAQEAIAVGVDAYILKPVNSRKLMDVLEASEKSPQPERLTADQLLQQFPHAAEQEKKENGSENVVSGYDLTILEMKLRHAREEDLDSIYQSYFHRASDDSTESVLFRYYLLMNLIMTVDTLLQEHGEQAEQMTAVSLFTVAGSWKETKEVSTRYIKRYIQLRSKAEDTCNSREIIRAKEYIDTHFCESDLSLNQVAQIAGFSSSYFSTLFAQEAGVSFMEYLTNCRMKKARGLLREGKSLQTVALRSGYSDPYYFSQVFKKNFGISPKEFQNQK